MPEEQVPVGGNRHDRSRLSIKRELNRGTTFHGDTLQSHGPYPVTRDVTYVTREHIGIQEQDMCQACPLGSPVPIQMQIALSILGTAVLNFPEACTQVAMYTIQSWTRASCSSTAQNQICKWNGKVHEAHALNLQRFGGCTIHRSQAGVFNQLRYHYGSRTESPQTCNLSQLTSAHQLQM